MIAYEKESGSRCRPVNSFAAKAGDKKQSKMKGEAPFPPTVTAWVSTARYAMNYAISEKRRMTVLYYPILASLVFFVAIVIARPIDNDLWWILSIGKNIIRNGIPTVEPLAMHEGLEFIAQQWLSSVIFASVYQAFGMIGLKVLVLLGTYLALALFCRLCATIGNETHASGIAAILGMWMLVVFCVSRPQLFTYSVLLTELIALERYAQSNRWKHLIPIPILSFLEINLHSSTWPMMFILAAPYFAEAVLGWMKDRTRLEKLSEEEVGSFTPNAPFQTFPLFCTAVLSLLCGLINPYGLKAITYIFRSYGIPSINSMINEMKAVQTNDFRFLYIFCLIVLLCIGIGRKKSMPIRYWLLAAGTIYLALSHAKGIIYFCIGTIPILGYVWQDLFIPDHILKKPILPSAHLKTLSVVMAVVMLCVGAAWTWISSPTPVGEIEADSYEEFGAAEALRYAENNCGLSPDSTIYAEYATGGYLELFGYKPYIDARAEVFLEANNGKFDYYVEYLKTQTEPFFGREFLKKYDFDFIFISTYSSMYDYLEHEETEYTKVFASDNDKHVVTLWAKS